MSADQLRGADAAAFQIAALLESYEEGMEALDSAWPDSALNARVQRELEAVRLACAALPMLAVAWLHLRISHAERVHALWNPPGTEAEALAGARQRHLHAVHALRKLCLGQFSRMERTH